MFFHIGEKEGIFMAGLQITPGTPGISAPTAPTTRTGSSVDGTAVNSSRPDSTENRTPVQREESAVDRAVVDRREKEQADRARESEQKNREETLENVVSVSEDGDTVQVSDEGSRELDESASGTVISQTDREPETSRFEEDIEIEPITPPEITPIEAPEIASETAAAEETESADRDITSFAGYTDQQVEQMYLEGEISQNDYNNEIARREEMEASEREEREQLSRDMGRLDERASRNEMADFAIENAVESGNDKIGLNERLQAVDSLFEDRVNATRRQEEAGRLWDYQLRA